jgi:hypothetical protein
LSQQPRIIKAQSLIFCRHSFSPSPSCPTIIARAASNYDFGNMLTKSKSFCCTLNALVALKSSLTFLQSSVRTFMLYRRYLMEILFFTACFNVHKVVGGLHSIIMKETCISMASKCTYPWRGSCRAENFKQKIFHANAIFMWEIFSRRLLKWN